MSHEHDYYWERAAYESNCVQQSLDTAFPPDLPSIRHAVISSVAQKSLKRRRSIEATVVPNVFDFETPAPQIDDFNADFRAAIGLSDDDFDALDFDGGDNVCHLAGRDHHQRWHR